MLGEIHKQRVSDTAHAVSLDLSISLSQRYWSPGSSARSCGLAESTIGEPAKSSSVDAVGGRREQYTLSIHRATRSKTA